MKKYLLLLFLSYSFCFSEIPKELVWAQASCTPSTPSDYVQIKLSHDSKYLIVYEPYEGFKFININTANFEKAIYVNEIDHPVGDFVTTSDNKNIIDSKLSIWDVEKKDTIDKLEFPSKTHGFGELKISDDNKFLIGNNYFRDGIKEIRKTVIWNLQTRKIIKEFNDNELSLYFLFVPNSTNIIYLDTNNILQTYDIVADKIIQQDKFLSKEEQIKFFEISPKGSYLSVLTDDFTWEKIKMWDIKKRKLLYSKSVNRVWVEKFYNRMFSQDENFFLYGSLHKFYKCKTNNGSEIDSSTTIDYSNTYNLGYIFSMAFLPEENYVLVGDPSDGIIDKYDLKTKKLIGTILSNQGDVENCKIFGDNGRVITIENLKRQREYILLQISNFKEKFRYFVLEAPTQYNDENNISFEHFMPLAVSPDNTIAAFVYHNQEQKTMIALLNLKTDTIINSLGGENKSLITNLDFSRDGKYLVSSSLDSFVTIWNIDNWKIYKRIKIENQLIGVSFTKDSKNIFILSRNVIDEYPLSFSVDKYNIIFGNTVSIYSTYHFLEIKSNQYYCFSKNDSFLIVLNNWNEAINLNLRTGQPNKIEGDFKHAVAISSDSKYIALVPLESEKINLYDINTLEIVASIDNYPEILFDNKDSIYYNRVTCLDFSSDDKYLAYGDWNGNMTIWNVEDIITGIKEYPISQNTSINIYPNPADNYVNIDISSFNTANMNLKVVDLIGNIILQKSIKSERRNIIKLNTSSINPGLYYLIIENDKQTFNQKLIIY